MSFFDNFEYCYLGLNKSKENCVFGVSLMWLWDYKDFRK